MKPHCDDCTRCSRLGKKDCDFVPWFLNPGDPDGCLKFEWNKLKTKEEKKSVQEEIKDFSLRAAGRLFHLMTGKEATCKIDKDNDVCRKVPIGRDAYTFEVWVNSGDLACCIEGTWCGETHSPLDFTTRIMPQEWILYS